MRLESGMNQRSRGQTIGSRGIMSQSLGIMTAFKSAEGEAHVDEVLTNWYQYSTNIRKHTHQVSEGACSISFQEFAGLALSLIDDFVSSSSINATLCQLRLVVQHLVSSKSIQRFADWCKKFASTQIGFRD